MDDFPVFTRKVHTDVSYLACARKLIAAPDAVYPQFATHNAQTLASVVTMAGPNFYRGQYEFQCLHGMGEPLYEEVVGRDKLDRPCRVYAPVGSHETLLAYLVRRLLENGANTSFVNRVADASVAMDELVADPVALARTIQPLGAPTKRSPCPAISMARNASTRAGSIFRTSGASPNSPGSWSEAPDASARLSAGRSARRQGRAGQEPRRSFRHRRACARMPARTRSPRRSPPPRRPRQPGADVPPNERAAILRLAAERLEELNDELVGLIVREAGKSYANAVAEVREAADFLRYYAAEAVRTLGPASPAPLGVVACISPWNFPLAIFTGQVAAALAAGNAVVAKPAEETPLIAAEAVRALHEAGVPTEALAFLPGAGEVGAAIVADSRVQGVVFTGSTPVARLIERELAGRLTRKGAPVPLIAETGGVNAMVVDSSALPEQVVADVVSSAFDSAGQRCSALRILCLQDDVADRMLAMLKGAMAELEVGDTRKLSADVGPVITADARNAINIHVEAMWGRGYAVTRAELPEAAAWGTFVAPTLIEIDKVADVGREVFGPVLHVLRYRRQGLDALIDSINAAGYGLTFGLHTRIDETIGRVVERIEAGNIYVNRNIIGATVGVQPFGGSRLSGTGPKAGGPLYLARLVAEPPQGALAGLEGSPSALGALRVYIDWLRASGHAEEAERCVGSPRARRSERASNSRGRSASAMSMRSGGAAGSRLWRRTVARR